MRTTREIIDALDGGNDRAAFRYICERLDALEASPRSVCGDPRCPACAEPLTCGRGHPLEQQVDDGLGERRDRREALRDPEPSDSAGEIIRDHLNDHAKRLDALEVLSRKNADLNVRHAGEMIQAGIVGGEGAERLRELISLMREHYPEIAAPDITPIPIEQHDKREALREPDGGWTCPEHGWWDETMGECQHSGCDEERPAMKEEPCQDCGTSSEHAVGCTRPAPVGEPVVRLRNLMHSLADDVMDMSDEEIEEEVRSEGLEPFDVAAQMRERAQRLMIASRSMVKCGISGCTTKRPDPQEVAPPALSSASQCVHERVMTIPGMLYKCDDCGEYIEPSGEGAPTDSTKVQRYDSGASLNLDGTAFGVMTPTPTGQYVHHARLEEALGQVARLESERDGWRESEYQMAGRLEEATAKAEERGREIERLRGLLTWSGTKREKEAIAGDKARADLATEREARERAETLATDYEEQMDEALARVDGLESRLVGVEKERDEYRGAMITERKEKDALAERVRAIDADRRACFYKIQDCFDHGLTGPVVVLLRGAMHDCERDTHDPEHTEEPEEERRHRHEHPTDKENDDG